MTRSVDIFPRARYKLYSRKGGPIAKLAKATVCKTVIRRFESGSGLHLRSWSKHLEGYLRGRDLGFALGKDSKLERSIGHPLIQLEYHLSTCPLFAAF